MAKATKKPAKVLMDVRVVLRKDDEALVKQLTTLAMDGRRSLTQQIVYMLQTWKEPS